MAESSICLIRSFAGFRKAVCFGNPICLIVRDTWSMNKKAAILCLLLALILCLSAGCEDKKNKDGEKAGEKVDENIAERWAISSERDEPVMIFYKDGTADFYGTKYKSYEVGTQFINFTSEDGTVTPIRYYEETDTEGTLRRFVYRSSDYKLVPGLLEGDGPVVGYWQCGGLTYQFTAKGTFLEDGALPGHYTVFQANGESGIVLSYDGHLSDTILFYKLNGDTMTVDYPWALVKMP